MIFSDWINNLKRLEVTVDKGFQVITTRAQLVMRNPEKPCVAGFPRNPGAQNTLF